MIFQSYKTAEGTVKGRVIYRLLGLARNQKLLEGIPFLPCLDLAVVFYLYVRIPEYGLLAMQITSEQMEGWKLTAQDLYRQAQENTQEMLPGEFRSLQEIFRESFPLLLSREGSGLYVLTNTKRRYGAAAILYEEQLSAIGRRLEEDFYVLPSSIHEMLVVPASGAPEREVMREIVREVNATMVRAEEILSDSVYFYDRQEGKLLET